MKFLTKLHGKGFVCHSKFGKHWAYVFEGLNAAEKEYLRPHIAALAGKENFLPDAITNDERFPVSTGIVVVVNQDLENPVAGSEYIEQPIALLAYRCEERPFHDSEVLVRVELYNALTITHIAVMPALYRSDIITSMVRHLLAEKNNPVLATEAANFSPLPAFDKAVNRRVERLVSAKEFNLDIITDGTYLLFV